MSALFTDPHRKCVHCGERAGVWPDGKCPSCGKSQEHPAAITREQAMEDLATRLYEQSDEFDPSMPNLVQRSGITRSRWYGYADALVEATPWLAAFIASLPSEEDEKITEEEAVRRTFARHGMA